MKRISLVADAGMLSFANIVTQIITMVSTMLLSRYLSLTDYGTYSQILIVIQICTSIFMLGLPNSLNYFLTNTKGDPERNDILSTYYTICTILGFLSGLLLVLLVPQIENYFETDAIRDFVYFLAVFPWTRIVTSGISNQLLVYHKTMQLVVFRLAHSVCIIAAILITRFLRLRFDQYMLVYLCVEAVFSFVVYVLSSGVSGRLRICLNGKLLKELLQFSIPLGIALASTTLKAETDKLVIGFFFSGEQLAIYTNAAKELPVTIIATSLSAVIMPRVARYISEGSLGKAAKLWRDSTALSLIVHVYFAFALFVFRREAITCLYSAKYALGADAFGIYSLVYIVRATYFGAILSSMGKTKYVMYTELIMLAANFVLNIVFYYWFGFVGPAVATLLVSLLGMLVILGYTSGQTSIKISQLFPWKEFAVILAANVTLGVCFYCAQTYLPLDVYIGEILEAVLLAIVWGIIVLAVFRRMIHEGLQKLNTYQ